MNDTKGRRDWIIAVSAAVIGSLAVPLIGTAVNVFKAGPRVTVDMVYGPYSQLPDLALQQFGYKVPDSRNSLRIENVPDGAKVEKVRPFEGGDIPSEFGQGDDLTDYGGIDRLVALTIKNDGATEAKSVSVYLPYPSVVAVRETAKTTKIHYIGSSGSKIFIGDILPGQSRIVRVWMRSGYMDEKPASKIRVYHDDGKLAAIRRRGSDSISSYIVSYTGPTMIILSILGLLFVIAIFAALVEALLKFLFPEWTQRLAAAKGVAGRDAPQPIDVKPPRRKAAPKDEL